MKIGKVVIAAAKMAVDRTERKMAALSASWSDDETVGAHFEKGEYTQAFDKCRGLAESGSIAAQVFLGWMYEAGLGVEKDLEQARHWYEVAAAAGSARGQFYLGRLCLRERNHQEAIRWLEKAGSQTYAPALFRLGSLYEVGVGVSKDHEKANRYLDQAASQGHLVAKRHMAVRMLKGQLGARRIPEGAWLLARIFWSALRLARKDPYDDRIIW